MTASTIAKSKNSFEVDIDGCYLNTSDSERLSAVLINPEASAARLISAAMRRADGLHQMLDAWAKVPGDEVRVMEVATVLEPIAQEVMLLLKAATERMFKTGVARKSAAEKADAGVGKEGSTT